MVEVDVVDIDGIRLLNECQTQGIQVVNCSPYIREWMLQENGQVRTKNSDSCGPNLLNSCQSSKRMIKEVIIPFAAPSNREASMLHTSPKRTSGPEQLPDCSSPRPQARASKAEIASNSDKPTSQHSLDENWRILFCCIASRRIRFSSKEICDLGLLLRLGQC